MNNSRNIEIRSYGPKHKIVVWLMTLFCILNIGALTAQECEIDSLTAEVVDCVDGEFFVVLNFLFANTSDSFRVNGNGNSYGTYAYGSIPLTLGPLQDGSTPYEFVVTDIDNQNCSDFVEVGVVDCGGCELSNLEIYEVQCTSDSTFQFNVDFDHANTGGVGFDLWLYTQFYGFYNYSDLPLTIDGIPSDTADFLIVTVCDNDNLLCCTSAVEEVPDCAPSTDCVIGAVNADIVDCENGEFYVILDFDYNNVSDSFRINGNGTAYGHFPYTAVPVTLGPLPANNTFYEFVVTDLDFPDCSNFLDVGLVSCDSNMICALYDLVVEFDECTSDSTYRITLDFEYINTGGVGFDLWANGDFFEFYPYSALPLTINNFPLGPGNANGLTICDNDNPNCCISADWQTPDCDNTGNCEIWDLAADVVDCENGEFFVILDFNYVNTSDSFRIAGNGVDYGDFAYGMVPVTLGPLEENNTLYEFVIIDLAFPDCSDFIDLGQVSCDTNTLCELYDLTVEFDECTSDTTYRIFVDFEYVNTGGVGFDLWANGDFFEFYPYSALPLTINNFPWAPGNVNWLTVCDNDNPNCCISREWPTPDCDNNTNCQIDDLVVEEFECDSISFYLDVDFEFANVGDSFKIVGNGNNYGVYSYADLPVTLGPLSTNSIYNELVVMDLTYADCMDFVELDIDCGSIDECEIVDLVVEEFDCDSMQFYLALDFEYANVGDSFKIIGNGNNYGTYSYVDLPVTLGPLSTNANYGELGVMDLTHQNCMDFVLLDIDCGSIDECELYELEVTVGDILNDSTFELTFNFEYENVSDSFHAFSGNMYVGTFAYADLPIMIEEFPSRGLPYELLRICDMVYMDCCVLIEFMVNDGDDCQITNPTAEVAECAGDTVFVWIDFDVTDGSSAGFEIIGNGNNYGEFQYDDLPVLISFVYNPGDFVDLIIRDLMNPNCLNYTFIDEVNCDTECLLTDIQIDFQECTSDTTYNFLIDLEYQGTGGLGFDLWGNGDYIGFYLYSQLPAQVVDFHSTGVQIDQFEVCDNDNLDCCNVFNIPIPSCISGLHDPDQARGLVVKAGLNSWNITVSEPGLISIYDVSGREVRSTLKVDRALEISGLPSGVYFINWSGWWGNISKHAVFIGQ